MKSDAKRMMKIVYTMHRRRGGAGYTDPEEVRLIADLINTKMLNPNSFRFLMSLDGVYQNSLDPFTEAGYAEYRKRISSRLREMLLGLGERMKSLIFNSQADPRKGAIEA